MNRDNDSLHTGSEDNESDIVNLLPEYLDMGVDQEEMRQIALAALAQRVRDIKLAVAQSVVQARASTLLDNLEGANAALQQARRLQREYHEFYAQWLRLGETGNSDSGVGPSLGAPVTDPNVPADGSPGWSPL